MATGNNGRDEIMDFSLTVYKALGSGLFAATFPSFWLYTRLSGRYRKGLQERLGLIPPGITPRLEGSPRIWMHAVSLGEIRVAHAVYEAIRTLAPDASFIVSSTTDHGVGLARETFQGVPVVYAPFDAVFCVRKALSRIRPDVMVFLETEIWPAWIHEAHKMGARVALLNGRISRRSAGTYIKFRGFWKRVLKNVDALSMIGEEDARRIRRMGADPAKVMVNGNAKYDLLAGQADPAFVEEMRAELDLTPRSRVLVAGSTRRDEESMVLDAYDKILRHFPDTLLFIAPRHIDRTPAIASLLKSRGYAYQLRSHMIEQRVERRAPVVIMNTFGELFSLYSVGTIVFCGGSLVPLGGQNPLEPAAWGKAAFYGPFMENFPDAEALLARVGGGIRVSSTEDFAERAVWFLNHPEELEARGARARNAVIQNQKAAIKHARVIADLI